MPHEVTRTQLSAIKRQSADWGIKDPLTNEWHYADHPFNRGPETYIVSPWCGKTINLHVKSCQFDDGRNVDLLIGQCDCCGRVYWH